MKLAALATLFVPGMAFAAWTTTDFPAFTEEGTGRFISQKVVEKGTRPLQLNFDQQCWQPSGGIKLNQMLSMEPVAAHRRNGASSARVCIPWRWIPVPARQR